VKVTLGKTNTVQADRSRKADLNWKLRISNNQSKIHVEQGLFLFCNDSVNNTRTDGLSVCRRLSRLH